MAGCSLKSVVKRWCNIDLPKELQASDWFGDLTPEQIAYARRDVEVLDPLMSELNTRIAAAGLERTADIELRALPAFVWMSQSGCPFEREAWLVLEKQAKARRDVIEVALNDYAPKRNGTDLFGGGDPWNWQSPKQVGEVLAHLGYDVASTNDAQLALIEHPFADAMRSHREEATRINKYGQSWVDSAEIVNGRLYPEWRQMGTATGRTACGSPPVQGTPRYKDPKTKKKVYRQPFAAPPGKVLVKCDYSTAQMRGATRLAGDETLMRIFAEDTDPHVATAKLLLGKQEINEDDRQIAKSANFGLLFGMLAKGLRVYSKMTWGVNLSKSQAEIYRNKWLQAYAGIARWHQKTEATQARETRTTSGRRVLLTGFASLNDRLNYPVQGLEGDGAKYAMSLLWERRSQCSNAVPVLFNHDEIVVECPEAEAIQAQQWLEECMQLGMAPWLDPVPVKVESSVGQTWGGGK